jgi:hypothetical protein
MLLKEVYIRKYRVQRVEGPLSPTVAKRQGKGDSVHSAVSSTHPSA